ncbi:L,D-transpeptidase [Streptomyces sp. NPDC052687]|uniref:L,D-transpeptidase family protein n=1 Tax=Streptomyces sp. NPDC052687 TaxID=3154759 RepID=UPI003429562D
MISGNVAARAARAAALALVAAALLPVGAGWAAPEPPDPATDTAGQLVPGVYQPGPVDTPDQVLAPQVHQPSVAEDALEPSDAPQEAYALVEYVPLADAVGRVACSAHTGPYQREVETWLELTVDGEQSAADCEAIRAFQAEHGIKPAIGFAGPVTWSHMRFLAVRDNPNAAGKCPVRTGRVACVDLDRQLTWVQQGEKVLFGPVPVRSGRAAYPTRTGTHTVYWRHKNYASPLYNTPMPYAQFFSGAQAFHAVYDTIHTTVGSMGCVNLRLGDARRLWDVLRTGDQVHVWGRRPG